MDPMMMMMRRWSGHQATKNISNMSMLTGPKRAAPAGVKPTVELLELEPATKIQPGQTKKKCPTLW